MTVVSKGGTWIMYIVKALYLNLLVSELFLSYVQPKETLHTTKTAKHLKMIGKTEVVLLYVDVNATCG